MQTPVSTGLFKVSLTLERSIVPINDTFTNLCPGQGLVSEIFESISINDKTHEVHTDYIALLLGISYSFLSERFIHQSRRTVTAIC